LGGPSQISKKKGPADPHYQVVSGLLVVYRNEVALFECTTLDRAFLRTLAIEHNNEK